MKVGVVCESSGTVRDAFIALGHDAISYDLLPTESPGPHIQGDVCDQDLSGFDLLICHPTCTYLCNSGVHCLHHPKRYPDRWQQMEEAAKFFKWMLELPCPRICVENPVPHKYAMAIIKTKYAQTIQPYQFGDPESKRTCLWLKGLPHLKHTNVLHSPLWVKCPDGCDEYWCTRHKAHVADCRCPDLETLIVRGLDPYVDGGPWRNQTPSGQSKLGPSADRWKIRSKTYSGIAQAMASQWGSLGTA